MHLFACLGGYIWDTATQDTHALSVAASASSRCSDWLHRDCHLHSASQLAMGVLYIGCDSGRAHITLIGNDQRQIL